MKISALSTTLGKKISNPNYGTGYVVIIADALKEHRTYDEPLARARKPVKYGFGIKFSLYNFIVANVA
jgi:hypothetical protein